jgi:hypothetical protein
MFLRALIRAREQSVRAEIPSRDSAQLGPLGPKIMKGEDMPKFIEMDDMVTLFAQMEAKGGPVILINLIK